MRPEPHPPHPVHIRLCRFPQRQYHPKVCGGHHSDRIHHWQGWSSLQEGGGQSGVKVWGQQLHPQRRQDEGDDSGHEEEEDTSSATQRGWAALNTWASTSVMTSLGHLQRLYFLQRLRNFGMSLRSSATSTAALLRASWPTVSPCGTAALLLWTTNARREW